MRNPLLSLLTLTLSLCLTACGGGGGGGGSSSSTPAFSDGSTTTAENTHPISVNGGPVGIANLAFTSVTICVPGTTQCQTIDNIIVDTGSTGLRLAASAVTALSLPAQLAPNSDPLYACAVFVDTSYGWGAVRRADVKLGNYSADNISIHLFGDGAQNLRPAKCGSGDSDDDLSSVANMGGNGILGVGNRLRDCGPACVSSASDDGYYFSCNGSGCTPSIAFMEAQLKNPVAFFSSDNNGVIIDLPAVPSMGAASVTGSMIFGIGTRANNSLDGATVFTTDEYGYIITRYNGVDYPGSYIDSGSNGLFFPDVITQCPGFEWFYCPSSTLTRTARIIGLNNNSALITFTVANAASLNFNLNAFNNLAGPADSEFDWGLPFFFGRKVYTGFDTDTQEPYTAF